MMKNQKVLVINCRYPYTIDNISLPKKYIISSKNVVKYVFINNLYSDVYWSISAFLFILNYFKLGLINKILRLRILKIIKKKRLDIFITFSKDSFYDKFFLNETNLKSVQIMHGNFMGLNAKRNAKYHLNWDYIFVWSEHEKREVLKYFPEFLNRVFFLGRPSKTFSVLKNNNLVKDKILYIGNPFMRSDFDPRPVREKHFMELREWSKKNDVILYYKPHPSEFKKHKSSMLLAKKYGFIVLSSRYGEDKIAEEFDIAITIASSYGQELRLYGIQVIQYDVEDYIGGFEYDLTKVGVEYKVNSILEFDSVYQNIVKLKTTKRSYIDPYFLSDQKSLDYPINKGLQNILHEINQYSS